MGIDIHAFNFIMLQAKKDRLGSVLTIGRQSLSLNKEFVESRLGTSVDGANSYCDALLMAWNASNVASLDYSDYESATYAAQPFYLKAWRDGEASSVRANQNRGLLVNFGRNLFLILGLASGFSRFSIKNSHFKRVSVEEILRGTLR